MTDIEGFLTIYGHSDTLLNNNVSRHSSQLADGVRPGGGVVGVVSYLTT